MTEEELGFRLPPGYRVLEDGDFVVVVNPTGTRIFVGSAMGATCQALQTAIEQDLRGWPAPGGAFHPDDRPQTPA
ncbi:MAG: hypothetical protein QN163_01865 [Armatimonadota bacterium]|nr:hypothetical protein [Armatimonadota bacterium]